MVYTLRFFSSNCSLFHNSNVFGSCKIHILYTGVLKFKKNNFGTKRLKKKEKFQVKGVQICINRSNIYYVLVNDVYNN